MNKHSLAALAVGAASILLVAGCRDSRASGEGGKRSDDRQATNGGAADKPVTLVVAYGSEKRTWLEDEAARFLATSPRTKSGKAIAIDARPMGSGEAASAIANGTLDAQVFAPASKMYLAEADRAAHARGGEGALAAEASLFTSSEPIAISPVVIAMWRPMAEALGWPARRLGWADVVSVASGEGWARYGHAEWGRFKLGHTNPELSSSGLAAVVAEAYAGAGKTRDLTLEDLDAPATRTFVRGVEGSIVHYGTSTGFFVEKMLARGPGSLSALVAYENLVVESYGKGGPAPLVAVYPREGTFWADHPYAITRRASPEQQDAATLWLRHLRSRGAQERALALGLRPADPAVAIGAPIDAAHGASPKEPETLLPLPSPEVTAHLVRFWKETKRGADVTLVFDKSGSMRGTPLAEAQAGARTFVGSLAPEDAVAFLPFDGTVHPARGPFRVGTERGALETHIGMTAAFGGTALYDAIAASWDAAATRAAREPERIHAVVVMTDGRDENSSLPLPALLAKLAAARGTDGETPVRIFAIAYGDGADEKVLAQIAESARGSSWRGRPEDIRKVYAQMAAFF